MPCTNHPEMMEAQKCSLCGKDFCMNCLVEMKGKIMCGNCKNDYLRSIQTGTVGLFQFAGFWIRFGAYLIDYFLLYFLISLPMTFAVTFLTKTYMQDSPYAFAAIIGLQLFNLAITVAYYTIMHGRFGQTVGKMACRIKVINQDGTPISYLKAFGRYWGFLLSSIILQIGNIMAGFDEEKKALHDRMCTTFVVYK